MEVNYKELRRQVALRILMGVFFIIGCGVGSGAAAVIGSWLLKQSLDLTTVPWGWLAFVGGCLSMFVVLYLGYATTRVAPVVYRMFVWYGGEVAREREGA